MTVFLLIAAALLVVVLVVLLRPLTKGAAPIAADTAASNLRILRAQLAELDAERDSGTLDETQYASARGKLERRMLEETAVTATPSRAASGPRTALALALALPLLAVALYWQLGSRDGLDPTLAVAQADPHAAEQHGHGAGGAAAGRAHAGRARQRRRLGAAGPCQSHPATA